MLNQTSGGRVAGTALREATSLSIILSGDQRTVQTTLCLTTVNPLPLCGFCLGGNSWSDFRGTRPLPNKTKLKHDQDFRASALN